MSTGAEMLKKLESVNIDTLAGDIIEREHDQVRDKVIRQLMQGLGSDGQPLHPTILEDPYFRNKQAAWNYAQWKKKLYPETPFGAPNLIINGYYHSGISFRRSSNTLIWGATAEFARDIDGKYQNKQLGLSPASKRKVWVEDVRKPLIKEISRITGIKTG